VPADIVCPQCQGALSFSEPGGFELREMLLRGRLPSRAEAVGPKQADDEEAAHGGPH
jgi:hypothetical protein